MNFFVQNSYRWLDSAKVSTGHIRLASDGQSSCFSLPNAGPPLETLGGKPRPWQDQQAGPTKETSNGENQRQEIYLM